MSEPLFPLSAPVSPRPDDQREAILADPGYGQAFSDHMIRAEWSAERGWFGHELGAVQNISLHPSAVVLHYAMEIFEGLKAYRHADDSIHLFRPEMNAARFARSATRLTLPVLPEAVFVEAVRALVRADAAWVPRAEGTGPEAEKTLYLRPFMIAHEEFLGVRPPSRALFTVIASPAGAYFPDGVTGVRLWVSEQYSRAAIGGTGAAKCGGNYASGLAAQVEARDHGCDQALYLDGAEHRWLEESGTMNLCLITADRRLLTPGLGTILPGVTRDSVLALAGEHGLSVEERRIGYDELRSGTASGEITEMFACGTAAVITPVVAFRGADVDQTVGAGTPGETTVALRNHLLDIQFGRTKDERGWLQRVV